MWNLAPRDFGFMLTFSGRIDANDMRAWVAEARVQLNEPLPAGWGLVIDMRTLDPLGPEAQAVVVEGQKVFRHKGMQRSAVALSTAALTLQFRRLAHSSGIDVWERYINVNAFPDWEPIAEQWVTEGREPPL